MLNITLRRKARQLGRILRHSMLVPRTGQSHTPILVHNGELALTFIGHSGFFIQIGGKNILVDPNFARWLFILKRLRHPGLRIRELPAIDLVLVTHAHFDHLHRPSLRAIARAGRRKSGTAPIIVVPRHVEDLVSGLGFREVIAMDWWQEQSFGALKITHTPSQHWGARMLRDFHRGFGGYALRCDGQSVYHAGDTAYFHGFSEIGKRLRPQIALLPIGAYSPPSFRNVHTSPQDAVRAFQDLGARWMVPMHYGSFRLSHEPMEEPLQLLRQEAASAGVLERVRVLEEGRTQIFP
jgi:L-ascorbate metabolism protein UlaG (beta-lactamase superfamily)